METTFDLVVIGSGPGGYSAAIRAAQLGYKTAIIEKYSTLGGTCTNVGCIPSKALLDSTEHFYEATKKFETHGIAFEGLKLHFGQLIDRKNDVVAKNTSGIRYLMSKNKIEVIEGTASFVSDNELRIAKNDGTEQAVKATYIIIATGSKPATIPGVVIDKQRIITSTEALTLTEQPKSMNIIGGGVIGVEMASIFARIGVQVTVIEYADSLIPTMDKELGKELKKILTKQGVSILVSHRVQSVENTGSATVVRFLDAADQPKELAADYTLVAVGRKPYTTGLGLENTSIQLDDKGRIRTDEHLRTHAPGVYAIGDVVAGAMLAHKAEEEGVYAVEIINGQKPHIDYNLIPGVVYTWPEVAAAGQTEEQLKAAGIAYKVGKFPFAASGRARAAMESDGFVKVLSGTRYGEVLGVHIIGPRAADLIAQAVIGMHYETTDEDMYRMSYAHPTYSEGLKEAYLEASGQGSLNL
jgi:dihydrolipoamide dehydrogenase